MPMGSNAREHYCVCTHGFQHYANEFESFFSFLQLGQDWRWSLDAGDSEIEHGYPHKLLGISDSSFKSLEEGGGEGVVEGGGEAAGGANLDKQMAHKWAGIFCRGIFDPAK
jgi:hypothetical protein